MGAWNVRWGRGMCGGGVACAVGFRPANVLTKGKYFVLICIAKQFGGTVELTKILIPTEINTGQIILVHVSC